MVWGTLVPTGRWTLPSLFKMILSTSGEASVGGAWGFVGFTQHIVLSGVCLLVSVCMCQGSMVHLKWALGSTWSQGCRRAAHSQPPPAAGGRR